MKLVTTDPKHSEKSPMEFHIQNQALVPLARMLDVGREGRVIDWRDETLRVYLTVEGKALSISGRDTAPRLSADRLAVGSYTVCLYQQLSWPHTNP